MVALGSRNVVPWSAYIIGVIMKFQLHYLFRKIQFSLCEKNPTFKCGLENSDTINLSDIPFHPCISFKIWLLYKMRYEKHYCYTGECQGWEKLPENGVNTIRSQSWEPWPFSMGLDFVKCFSRANWYQSLGFFFISLFIW